MHVPDTSLTRRRLLLGAGVCALCGLAERRRLQSPTGWALAAASSRSVTEAERIAAQPHGIFGVTTDRPQVALTFDDGPDPTYTPQVLAQLDRFGAQATFFLVGVNARAHPGLVASERRAGHGVGNHTEDHAELELMAPDAVAREIDKGERSIVAAGAETPSLFRPPRGYTDQVVALFADAARYRTVFWDSCVEAQVNHDDVRIGVERLLDGVRPGSIILAHDGGHVEAPGRPVISRARTMEALPMLLDGLRALGLEAVDVETLLSGATTGAPTAALRLRAGER